MDKKFILVTLAIAAASFTVRWLVSPGNPTAAGVWVRKTNIF